MSSGCASAAQHFMAADGRKSLVLSSRLSAAAAFCRWAASYFGGDSTAKLSTGAGIKLP